MNSGLGRIAKSLLGREGAPPDAGTPPAKAAITLVEEPPVFAARGAFFSGCIAAGVQSVLEVGTARAVPDVSTMHRGHFGDPGPARYVCLDIKAGPDVDVVGDLHNLPEDWTGTFDAFIAFAVFEHLERPWIAAKEVARILKPGGRFLVSTHQCFPIHGYPSDFFRFSKDALRLIFEDAGLIVDVSEYAHRAAIVAPDVLIPDGWQQNWNDTFPSYILVEAAGRKRA
jgi:SAM-dependent methyltransferase